ncbi:hypothetical protein BDZ94DRAFT_1139037, partial [Collybia nuda]
MPARTNSNAPQFDGQAHSLRRFFQDFEYLAQLVGLNDQQKKEEITRYIDVPSALLWQREPAYIDPGKTFEDFKTAITILYPGASIEDTYRFTDLDELILNAQAQGIRSTGEFGAYYRHFKGIVDQLIINDRIGKREIQDKFLKGLPTEVAAKTIFRLQIRFPNQHV